MEGRIPIELKFGRDVCINKLHLLLSLNSLAQTKKSLNFAESVPCLEKVFAFPPNLMLNNK